MFKINLIVSPLHVFLSTVVFTLEAKAEVFPLQSTVVFRRRPGLLTRYNPSIVSNSNSPIL